MNIKIHNLTKCIKDNTVLDNVNLELQSGTVYGFKGVNGSGKTMLMRAICGLIYPSSGYVEIDGKVLGKDISFPESVGVLIENPSFIRNFTGAENLKALASIQKRIGEEEIRTALNEVGLNPDDKRPYRKYSLGMKQKLGVAAAVMEHPALIVLDEPLNALDEDGVTRVKRIIQNEKSRGSLIIIACHDAAELYEIADQIVEIECGIVKGITPTVTEDDLCENE